MLSMLIPIDIVNVSPHAAARISKSATHYLFIISLGVWIWQDPGVSFITMLLYILDGFFLVGETAYLGWLYIIGPTR